MESERKSALNASALIFVGVFAVALLSIFGAIYIGASKSQKKGEMGYEGILILRWALLGFATLYILLALSAFLV